jgi:large subunit ribosomal protein L23
MFLKPLITEKSLREAALKRYTFKVSPEATKTEIKKAAERLFKVNIIKIQTITMPGKKYRSGKRWIYRQKSDFKKAILMVKPDQKIELFDVTGGGTK